MEAATREVASTEKGWEVNLKIPTKLNMKTEK